MGWFKRLTRKVTRAAKKAANYGLGISGDPITDVTALGASEASRVWDKTRNEADRFKEDYRPYYDPFGYYKKESEAALDQAQKESDETQAEMERANAEAERIANENLELAKAAQEEEAAFYEQQMAEIRKQREEREAEEKKAAAIDAAEEAEAQKKAKSRNKRRIALVETSTTDEDVLGNTKVGRGRVLGN